MTLHVPLINDLPVIPAMLDGQPVRLADYDSFTLHDDSVPYKLSPRAFFARFIPSRLLYEGAGHG